MGVMGPSSLPGIGVTVPLEIVPAWLSCVMPPIGVVVGVGVPLLSDFGRVADTDLMRGPELDASGE